MRRWREGVTVANASYLQKQRQPFNRLKTSIKLSLSEALVFAARAMYEMCTCIEEMRSVVLKSPASECLFQLEKRC